MVLFLFPCTHFFFPLDNLLQKDIVLVPHEAHIARGIDTQALFAFDAQALFSLQLDDTHQFSLLFPWNRFTNYSGLVYV